MRVVNLAAGWLFVRAMREIVEPAADLLWPRRMFVGRAVGPAGWPRFAYQRQKGARAVNGSCCRCSAGLANHRGPCDPDGSGGGIVLRGCLVGEKFVFG